MELQQHLMSNYVGKIAYLLATSTNFTLTTTEYGHSACIGVANSTVQPDIQTLHQHYYDQLNAVFTHIYDYLDMTVSHLEDTIHSFTSDEAPPPVPIIDDKLIDEHLLRMLPTPLLNHNNKIPIFPSFEIFFKETVAHSNDLLIGQLFNKTILNSLSTRNKRIIISSLQQMNGQLTSRITSLAQIFNPEIIQLTVPKTILYEPTQNSVTFLYYARNLIPDLDENILTEIFIIIQNEKNTLLQDISFILQQPIEYYHATRSAFSRIQRKQRRNTDSIPIVPSTKPTTKQPETTEPTTTNALYIAPPKSKNYIHSNEHFANEKGFKIIPLKASVIPNPNNKTNTINRHKRSWGSFWGSVFSLATSDQITDVMQHKMDIGRNELSIQKQLNNITSTNNRLLMSLHDTTYSINKLVISERNLFTNLQEIMKQEEKSVETLHTMANTLDRTTSLIAEYLAIGAQTTLLIHSTSKLQSTIITTLTSTLDITQIPTSILRQKLQDNMELSLKLTSAEFQFTTDGYDIKYKMSILSPPFVVYSFHQIPYYQIGWWGQIAPNNYVMNDIHETIPYTDIKNLCQYHHNTYICKPNNIQIRPINETYDCAFQLIVFQTNFDKQPTACKFNEYKFIETQRHLINNGILLIASKVHDTLKSECKTLVKEDPKPISIGLTAFNIKKDCVYHTSYLTIYSPVNNEFLEEQYYNSEDLDIINQLSGLDSLLDSSIPDNINISVLHSQIEQYKHSLSENDLQIDKLAKNIEHLESINSIEQFNPMQFNIKQPLHASNWLAVMFWLFLTLSIFTCCCASHLIFPGWLKSFVKLPFNVIYKIVRNFIRRLSNDQIPEITNESIPLQRSAPPPPTQTHRTGQSIPPPRRRLYPSTSSESLFTDPALKVPRWHITRGLFEDCLLQAHTADETGKHLTVTYEPFTERITDDIDIALVSKL